MFFCVWKLVSAWMCRVCVPAGRVSVWLSSPTPASGTPPNQASTLPALAFITVELLPGMQEVATQSLVSQYLPTSLQPVAGLLPSSKLPFPTVSASISVACVLMSTCLHPATASHLDGLQMLPLGLQRLSVATCEQT